MENQYASSFVLQPSLELTFKYGGSFYSTEVIYVDPLPSGVLMRVAQMGVVGSWVAFGTITLANRKRLFS